MTRFGYGHHIPQIEHDALMISLAVARANRTIAGADRFLDRLMSALDHGASLRIDDASARRLATDVASLRALADAIMTVRDALIRNDAPRLCLVAAE